MHEIEPHWNWRDKYIAEEDERSPFFGREYNEFTFSTKIYNYFIHPQWDEIGSQTLYTKLIYANYDLEFAVIEMIGEWNDCLNNDIMFLKRNLIDPLIRQGIYKFALIGENVLNFHASDDCYYEEWWDDIKDNDGWIMGINFREHVLTEMNEVNLSYFMNYAEPLTQITWKPLKPDLFFVALDNLAVRLLK